jgi:hypothetical protein
MRRLWGVRRIVKAEFLRETVPHFFEEGRDGNYWKVKEKAAFLQVPQVCIPSCQLPPLSDESLNMFVKYIEPRQKNHKCEALGHLVRTWLFR